VNVRKINIKGRAFEVSDTGQIWRLAFTNRKGRYFAKLRLTPSNNRGYRAICFADVSGKTRKASVHRLVARAFLPNYCEKLWVDHINGIRSDNRAVNLRMVTSQENHRGRYRKIANAYSRYRGVTWEPTRRKWKASIYVNSRSINLGRFDRERDAAQAFDESSLQFGFPEEGLNFPVVQSASI